MYAVLTIVIIHKNAHTTPSAVRDSSAATLETLTIKSAD